MQQREAVMVTEIGQASIDAAKRRNKMGERHKFPPMGDKARVIKVREIIERWQEETNGCCTYMTEIVKVMK
jgi:hypothetical protein